MRSSLDRPNLELRVYRKTSRVKDLERIPGHGSTIVCLDRRVSGGVFAVETPPKRRSSRRFEAF